MIRKGTTMSDIGESNQRQSDFYWGYEDARAGLEPRCNRDAYMRGYRAGEQICQLITAGKGALNPAKQ